jgi:hypothetical protein
MSGNEGNRKQNEQRKIQTMKTTYKQNLLALFSLKTAIPFLQEAAEAAERTACTEHFSAPSANSCEKKGH